MTTSEYDNEDTAERLNANIARIEELSARLLSAVGQKKAHHPGLAGPGQDLYTKAAGAYFSEMMSHPSKIIEQQVGYWGKALKSFAQAQEQFVKAPFEPVHVEGLPEDKRFKSELWDSHPYFNFLKQQYLLTSEAIEKAVADIDDMEEKDKKRLTYFTRQIIDMMSPANYLGTNPEALTRAMETDGQSLVDGLENLVRDLERNDGDLLVTLADRDAFEVGRNIATTEGSVVFQNVLFELIQYAPTTETVFETPLLIFPPWINKFYILDLKEKNSLIKWIVDQGFTLFVVSWKNPDPSYRDTGMSDYVEAGYLQAMAAVKAITGAETINTVGYCIAGTTLALTLALLEKRGVADVVESATFFTTLTDFEDQGEVGVFLSHDFVDSIEAQVEEDGILDSFFMSRTFSFLRSNDLIYQPAIRSYMMGEAPPAFDLLYWNGDGTNLPACMAMEYLRGLCQANRFANEGFEVAGETVRLKDVKTPLLAVACETDHIAAWPSSFMGVRQMGSADKTFILSESGHIAGIVNPPSKKKYGHYTNGDWSGDAAVWKAGAEFHEGSWWPRWGAWLAERSGGMVPARAPGSEAFPVLGPAPGTYVKEVPESA